MSYEPGSVLVVRDAAVKDSPSHQRPWRQMGQQAIIPNYTTMVLEVILRVLGGVCLF